MKKTIRGLLKIPFTPFIVAWGLFIVAYFYVVQFGQYIYECSDWDKQITQDCIDEQYEMLKRWFTSV
jgi:hypothetical protein